MCIYMYTSTHAWHHDIMFTSICACTGTTRYLAVMDSSKQTVPTFSGNTYAYCYILYILLWIHFYFEMESAKSTEKACNSYSVCMNILCRNTNYSNICPSYEDWFHPLLVGLVRSFLGNVCFQISIMKRCVPNWAYSNMLFALLLPVPTEQCAWNPFFESLVCGFTSEVILDL